MLSQGPSGAALSPVVPEIFQFSDFRVGVSPSRSYGQAPACDLWTRRRLAGLEYQHKEKWHFETEKRRLIRY